jgi:hypothetical protein
VHLYLAHLVQTSRSLIVSAGLLALIISTGCGSSNWSASQQQTPLSVADVAARAATGIHSTCAAIYWNRNLVWRRGSRQNHPRQFETHLRDRHVQSAECDECDRTEGVRLFFMPGGNAVTISKSLTRTATTNLHNALVNDGMHYLGICAGGFFAGSSGIHHYLNLTPIAEKHSDTTPSSSKNP